MLKDIQIEYYTATWCGPCRTFKPEAKKMAANAGIQLTEIDVDQFTNLAMEAKVMSVPTVILRGKSDDQWHEIGRVTGASPQRFGQQLDEAKRMGYDVR